MIAASLSSSWGVEYTARSKRVWLRCDRGNGTPPDTRLTRPSRTVVVEGTVVAVVSVSSDGTIEAWNGDAAQLFGWAAQQVVGRSFHQVLDPASGRRPPEDLLTPGGTWQGLYSLIASDGSSVPVFASHTAADQTGGATLLLVPERQRAMLEHPAAPRPARGVDPASALLGLRDDALVRLAVDDFLPLAIERVRDTLDADVAYLLIGHDVDDSYDVAAVSGLPDEVRGRRVAAGDPGAPDARHPRLPLVVPDGAESQVPLLRDTRSRSLALVPVVAEGRVIGALAVASERRDGFGDDQCALLQRLADSLALPADRARLQASERERRGWLTFLSEAGDLLAHSLDRDMTVAITSQVVVPRLANWCAVHLVDERGVPGLCQVWHADERRTEELRQAVEQLPLAGLADAVDPALEGEVTTLPLVARSRRLGFLTLGRSPGNPLRDDVLLVAESIARRAALALDNSLAHGALLASGRALQRSLLPPTLPKIPGLDVGVVYEAAGEGSEVGGDFYDIFSVGGEAWCFVVGDVCGTGAEAAAVTGLARHTIRALTRAGFTVSATLERLNTAILEEGDRARFLTLVCGVFRRRGRSLHLSLVNAGHPAPFVADATGTVRRIGSPQMLLGVEDRVGYTAEDHVLADGELLVALTDGVLERRDGGRMLDDDGVVQELARCVDLPAQAVTEQLLRLVEEFGRDPQQDDMAILALRSIP
jgi:PAS domain S-box-containing protein